jgi:hypothetical protein
MFPPQLDRILHDYLHGKDQSRPHLLARAFAPDAVFVSRFEFDTDFSDDTPREGLGTIIETFRQLGAACENIYTVCASDSVRESPEGWRCKWLVTMTQRDDGRVRVAWGDYLWQLGGWGTRAKRLEVTMEEMQVLPADRADGFCDWMATHEGLWVESARMLEGCPAGRWGDGLAHYLLGSR